MIKTLYSDHILNKTEYKFVDELAKYNEKDVYIPTTDAGLWDGYNQEKIPVPKDVKDHLKLYNKGFLGIMFGHRWGPAFSTPTVFPVVLKPLLNMNGGGIDVKRIESLDEWNQEKSRMHPGMMWQEAFVGLHESFDIVIIQGHCFTTVLRYVGYGENGVFTAWESDTVKWHDLPPAVKRISTLVSDDSSFVGVINVESIGGTVIDVHLRPGDVTKFFSVEILELLCQLYDTDRHTPFDMEKMSAKWRGCFEGSPQERRFIFPLFLKRAEKFKGKVFYIDRTIKKVLEESNVHILMEGDDESMQHFTGGIADYPYHWCGNQEEMKVLEIVSSNKLNGKQALQRVSEFLQYKSV